MGIRCVAQSTPQQSENQMIMLAHVERMAKALEQARVMQLRRGPFNSRKEDR